MTGGIKKLEKGFYSIELDKSFTNVKFVKYKDSHKDTWGMFLDLLERLINQSNNVTTLTQYKIEVIDILSHIKSGITRSRCKDKGNWLSVIRNSVNYQHSHGVWYPYTGKPVAPSYIGKISTEWTRQPEELKSTFSKGDIEIFFEVTLMILSLFRELLISCSSKADRANAVFVNGCLRLLNNLQAA